MRSVLSFLTTGVLGSAASRIWRLPRIYVLIAAALLAWLVVVLIFLGISALTPPDPALTSPG